MEMGVFMFDSGVEIPTNYYSFPDLLYFVAITVKVGLKTIDFVIQPF